MPIYGANGIKGNGLFEWREGFSLRFEETITFK